MVRWFLDTDDNPDSHQNVTITFCPIYVCNGHTSATTRNSTKSKGTAPEESTWWKVETQNVSIRSDEGSASLVKSVKAQIAINWL